MFDPRTIPSSITFTTGLVLFGLAAAAIVGLILDSISTAKGLAAGLTEGNPVMRWAFSKIGQSATAFLSVVVVLAIALPLSTWHVYPAMLFCGGVAVSEFIQVYRNNKLLASKKS